MSLKTLVDKAKTGNQIRNLGVCQWNEKEVKTGNSKWVSVEDLKTFLDDYVLVPRKQLEEKVAYAHHKVQFWKDNVELRQIWIAVELSYKELLEASNSQDKQTSNSQTKEISK